MIRQPPRSTLFPTRPSPDHIAPHQRYPALPPNQIAAVVADHGRSDGGRHDSIDREMSQRREGGRRDQGSLAREREPEALEADQEEENDVAVGGNEPRYRTLHRANLRHLGSWQKWRRTATLPSPSHSHRP